MNVAAAMPFNVKVISLLSVAGTDVEGKLPIEPPHIPFRRQFRALLEAQVVVVATSNVAHSELYKGGLNRALFLPFIDLIGQHMEIEELLAARDFRLEKLVGKPLYFTPADARAKAEMDRLWGELTGNHPGATTHLEVKGRKLRVPLASMGVVRFAFADLCEAPLGANDFLHIAHAFHTVLIDAVPVLERAQRDVTRRFVNLVDTLYDSRVCLVASAAAEPQALYPGATCTSCSSARPRA